MDPDGAVADQGTFVVDQVSRTKFVVEFKSPLYLHAAYGTDRPDEAVFIAGEGWVVADPSAEPFVGSISRATAAR